MSTSRSRVRGGSRRRRDASAASVAYVPQPESLTLPDGVVGEGAAELLQEFVHPHAQHGAEETLIDADAGSEPLDEEERQEIARRKKLPWWKRPSAVWLMVAVPFSAGATSATMAPRIEIYTMLACSVHKPEYTAHLDLRYLGIPGSTSNSAHAPSYDIALGSLQDQSIAAVDVLSSTWDVLPPVDRRTLVEFVEPHNETSRKEAHKSCSSDPDVQAAVAKLSTAMTTTMGIISCLTTSWWGSLSDRVGRTRVMGLCILGLLVSDFIFILVARYSRSLPGGYWLMLAGPLIEGSLGGLSTASGISHAYAADCTEPASRSHTFSTLLGLLFTGIAVGPSIGALLIRAAPNHNAIIVFYFSTLVHICYALFLWTLLPESLTPAYMRAARESRAAAAPDHGLAKRLLHGVFGFLSPLTVLVTPMAVGANPLKKAPRRDWSLTLVAAAYGFTIMVLGSYPYKFQYATSTFGWTSEIIGYWLSMVGVSRAVFLTVILPLLIRLLKPKVAPIQLPVSPSEPLDADPSPSSSHRSRSPPKSPTAPQPHSSAFDLSLALASLAVDVVTYTLMGLANSSLPFTVATMLSSLGAGFGPAAQSVALDLYVHREGGSRETGKLFGALSVVNALSAQIVGPALFGLTYVKTVATMPKAVFFVSVANVAVSFVLLSFVRLPKSEVESADVEEQAQRHGQDETLVDVGVDDGGARNAKAASSQSSGI
ncbi:hypothetical protein PLICRDRAFT_41492 [Plicaturopsis crispa FD-325 SS-3]|nr:hypothetical protein PLICRDRAFT_41492 [Plicaturopsis crispa FD-325 SS-3]